MIKGVRDRYAPLLYRLNKHFIGIESLKYTALLSFTQPVEVAFLVVMKGCECLAQGAKTREEIIKESMSSPKVVDPTIDFKIHRSPKQYDSKEHKYKCMCCGAGFNGQQKNNFQRTLSPLFQSNDGFLPWCKYVSLSIFHKKKHARGNTLIYTELFYPPLFVKMC